MYKAHHIARELSANLATNMPLLRAWRVRKGRTVGSSYERKSRALLAQFEFFMSSIGEDAIRDQSVVEVGPGDTVSLAPLFIAAGARRYVAIDRFLGDVTSDEAYELFRSVAALAPKRLAQRLAGLRLSSQAQWTKFLKQDERVRLSYQGIEQGAPVEAAEADLILSFNVCEHLSDVRAAFTNMTALLAPQGRMIHRIDYGPHDIWAHYENPLAFLTVPGSVWRLMSSGRGCPNRVRHAEYLALARELGLNANARPGTQVSRAQIEAVRPKLAREFRHLSDAELAILDAEIVFGRSTELSLGAPYRDTLK